MSLSGLANELLVAVAEFLDAERDIDAFAKSNKRLYSLLIAHLYRYNADNSNASALVWAAKTGRVETLQRAVSTGVKVHEFALLPIASEEGHLNFASLLLRTPGVDVNVKNEDGWTSLVLASKHGHVDLVEPASGCECRFADQLRWLDAAQYGCQRWPPRSGEAVVEKRSRCIGPEPDGMDAS
ncbi:hypothetical protein J3458_016868 [Metarhizium acridum]|uniref:uncharacterized protein n=1 Tax=Metarhizium acridum TaxID=92637 RepID=UPI001C6CFE1D|nr:hypothetical protein J3458_016868 [Metarhizium acridum]